mgnify:CR=1 FL=1
MLYVASASPRRRDLLVQYEIDFECVPNELTYEPLYSLAFVTPASYVEALASMKAMVSGVHKSGWVLGADTIVVVDADVLGKPHSEDEAMAFLSRLSNRSHDVYSSFCLRSPCFKYLLTYTSKTSVIFSHLTLSMICDYIESHDVLDKAGGYGIQDLPPGYLQGITGSFYTVMGLDIDRLKWVLDQAFFSVI